MSVIKSKRGPSGMKFIDNARELEIFTIQRVAHFPKRYTFLISNKIADIAVSIYKNVVEGNMLTNLDDNVQYTSRLHHFREALSQCNALVSQLQIANDVFGIPYHFFEKWISYIDTEEKLLIGTIRKDLERRKVNKKNT